MESSIKAMFNQTAPVFIQRSSIHDLCSKQIASLIKKQKWIKPTDSIMVSWVIVKIIDRILVVV